MMSSVATATRRPGIPRLMDKAKKIARDERLRRALQDLHDTRFKSNAALARALGVEGPTITEILNGKRGVGLEVMESLADLTGRSLDELAGRPVRGRVCLADLPQWSDARDEAQKRLAHVRPEVAREALDRVASFALPPTSVALTGLFVAKLAEAIIANPHEF